MDAGKYGPILTANGIRVTSLNMPRGSVTFYGLSRLWKTLREERPAIIQTWMYHADLVGGVVARFANLPVLWNIRHTELDSQKSSKGTILVARFCAALSKVIPSKILCCADRALRIHGELGYDRKRMHVIPNGYDLSVFRPSLDARVAIRQELEIDLTVSVIGFVARYNPQKDHENLLQALFYLKQNHNCPICLLVGTGMDVENRVLSQRISELGLDQQVRLLGRRDDVYNIMNALDVHVMSSAFGEAFPNVIAEAMACGTPCVSTDVGDAAKIVGETGWVVPPRDPEQLANAIEAALGQLKSRSVWANRKKAAITRIGDNFTVEQMVNSYNTVWKQTLKNVMND
jgi:glycosyltransferase involved in cell wall biosynthesis